MKLTLLGLLLLGCSGCAGIRLHPCTSVSCYKQPWPEYWQDKQHYPYVIWRRTRHGY